MGRGCGKCLESKVYLNIGRWILKKTRGLPSVKIWTHQLPVISLSK